MDDADFGGYATRTNLRCSDGRTILAGAFDQNGGAVVPLVWQHGHNDPVNVLGHAKLELREDGVYAYGFFNATTAGQHAKEMVKHGDAKFLSIWANDLVERITNASTRAKDVVKGNIREVSLVLAGANPGAFIDKVSIAHGYDDVDEDMIDEAYITTGVEIEVGGVLTHADETKTVESVLATLNEEQQTAVSFLVGRALGLANGDVIEHSDTDPAPEADPAPAGDGDPEPDPAPDGDPAPEADVDPEAQPEGDPSPEAEPEADPAPVGDGDPTPEADPSPEAEPEAEGDDAVQHSNQEDNRMTHNVFDSASGAATTARPTASLSHGDLESIIEDWKTSGDGSLKKAFNRYAIQHGVMVDGSLQHGIDNIDYLFPDARTLENSPAFVSRRMEWVQNVLNGVRKSPFARIKSLSADITFEDARAKGYIKGNLKKEEFFALSKRETTPQTIYKKQKLDRDDVIDITDLDVVAWLKAEMRVMLDEELAGAILVGDGRSQGDEDKITETKIRPIATDGELYVTEVHVNMLDSNSTVEELVDAATTARKFYKGSGVPSFYTTEDTIAKFLNVKDNFGRRIYDNLGAVASALRVREVVPVEVMERDSTLLGIMVNLADYTLGMDRQGAVTMFDDFDLDYNKLIYLIETRCSGALTQPKSALVFRQTASNSVLLAAPAAPVFDEDDSTVTVPTVSNVVYHSGTAAGATLTTGAPVTLDEDEDLHVVAVAASGFHFANNAEDEWDFTGVATS